MTPEFKSALLQKLRETPDKVVQPVGTMPVLMMMLPWVENNFPAVDFKSNNPYCTINWDAYQEATGLKRLDFFIAAPDRTQTGETGEVIRTPYKKPVYSYPLPTIGSIIWNHKPTCQELSDLIEQHYVGAGSFDECLELIGEA